MPNSVARSSAARPYPRGAALEQPAQLQHRVAELERRLERAESVLTFLLATPTKGPT